MAEYFADGHLRFLDGEWRDDNGDIVEIKEVKHGKWQEHFSFGCWHYDCPFCDDGYATKEKDETPPNYCQNCGNKMDGKQMGCVNNG